MTIIDHDRGGAEANGGYRPSMWQIQHVALCCECGTQRSTTARGGTGEQAEGGTRCIVNRKCATCKKITPHAYLRDDHNRDIAESSAVPESEPEPERPFWLVEECPTWCTRAHHDSDGRTDRVHDGLRRFWVLLDGFVLTGDNRGDYGVAGTPPYIALCLRQDVRAHGLPNIAMQIGTGGFWGIWEMDRDLAACVMEQIRHLLDVIDGEGLA